MNQKEFGLKIKFARLAKGMLQDELAEKTGTNKAYISNLENGKINPTLQTINKVCDALNICIWKTNKEVTYVKSMARIRKS